MKLKLFLAAIALFAASTAIAKVTPIADWDGGLPNKGETQGSQTSCASACSGYDLTTLICPSGQTLESCPTKGCSYYHRCR